MSAMLAGLQANFIKRVLTSQPQIQLLRLTDKLGQEELEADRLMWVVADVGPLAVQIDYRPPRRRL